MENVIKNMNVKPMLDRAEFERLDPPAQNSNVNLRVGDTLELSFLRDDVVKVSVSRSVVANPECIFKIYVEMSAEVLVDRAEYDKLSDAEDFFKKTPIVRLLVSHVSTVIAEMTAYSAIGPMITPPVFQN